MTWTCGRREIYVRGKGGKDRIVRIDRETARRIDRYLRARAKHPQAYHARLWLGAGDRGPLTRDGIYRMIKRRGARPACGSTRTGSGTTSATPGWNAAAPKET